MSEPRNLFDLPSGVEYAISLRLALSSSQRLLTPSSLAASHIRYAASSGILGQSGVITVSLVWGIFGNLLLRMLPTRLYLIRQVRGQLHRWWLSWMSSIQTFSLSFPFLYLRISDHKSQLIYAVATKQSPVATYVIIEILRHVDCE